MNTHLVDDKISMPRIEELLAEIGAGDRFFAKIDLETAYHQILLVEECRPLTAIVTSYRNFQYTVIPFGLKTAPSCFQRIMQRLLKDCRGRLVYQDDILIAGKTSAELGARRNAVEKILNDKSVKINESKSTKETYQVDWLGFEISSEGIRPSRMKTEKIRSLTAPTTVNELRQLLGVINYYCSYVPNLASLAQPLFNRLKNDRT